MSFFILLICFCGFEFPSGIMSSFYDSFASTYVLCATVVKYIIFLYIIGPTTYWYTNGCSQLLFKSAKEKKKETLHITFYFELHNYFYWCSLFGMDLNFPLCLLLSARKVSFTIYCKAPLGFANLAICLLICLVNWLYYFCGVCFLCLVKPLMSLRSGHRLEHTRCPLCW